MILIEQNAALTLFCDATGLPIPKAEWFKVNNFSFL